MSERSTLPLFPRSLQALALLFSVTLSAVAATASASNPKGFPFTDEDLNYSVNWPSGLSLGEAHLHARKAGANWNLSLNIDAGVPGYAVKDVYRSVATSDLCSSSFERNALHGSRNIQERESIDLKRSLATRLTLGKEGGKSEFPVPMCAKDALTLLYFARRELGQGRVPSPQQFLFGALYDIRMSYAGPQMITSEGGSVQSDKIVCTVKAGSSEYAIDMYFARDAARTPLRISAPLSMGKFSMELIH